MSKNKPLVLYVKKSGFTIIEVLVAVTVIGIISAISFINYGQYNKNAVETQIKSDLKNALSALESYRNFNNGYPLDINTVTNFKASSNITLSGGGYADGKTYCIEATSSRDESLHYNISSDNDGKIQEGSCPETIPTPTIAATLNGANVQATVTAISCGTGTAEYAIRSRTNDGSWGAFSSWSTGLTASQTANDGVKYGYQAQARCYVGPSDYTLSGISSESTYIDPIIAPSAPIVTANTVDNTTTWSWPAVTCAVGTTRYQYQYTISPSGYDSGWVSNGANLSIAFTTTVGGQTYTVNTQAQCYNSYSNGTWSVSGSANFIRPTTPSAPVTTVILNGANVQATITPVTCTGSTTQYGVRSRTDDGTWGSYSAWNTTLVFSQAASDGVKYGYQAQARCYVDASTYSSTATGAESTYIDPIPAPSAPVVTANTVSDTTTWSWPAVSCAVGTARYQYQYTISPSGYNSGWVNNGTNLSIAFTTSTQGETYTVNAQAQCYNAYSNGTWSASGSANYYRPVIPPSFITALGGSGDDRAYDVCQTSDGGYAMTGNTPSYGAGGDDLLIAKFAANGTLSWSKTLGNSGSDYGKSITQTADGGYFVVGYSTTLGSAGGNDVLLAKFTSDGTLSWSKTWGGAENDYGFHGIQTSDGGYAIAGSTRSYSASYSEALIVKFTSTGTLSWARTIGNDTGSDEATNVIEMADNGLIISGTMGDFGTGNDDIFLAKYTSTGTLSWSKAYGGVDFDSSESAAPTADGGVIAVGKSSSYGAGDSDLFFVKVNSAGTLAFSKSWGSTSNETGHSVTQLSDGGYVIAGYTSGYGAGSADTIITKFTSAGALSWSKTWGGTLGEYSRPGAATADGGFVLTGYEESNSAGDFDMYIAKFLADGTITNCSSPLCQSNTPPIVTPSPSVTNFSAIVSSPSPASTSVSPTVTSINPTITVVVAP